MLFIILAFILYAGALWLPYSNLISFILTQSPLSDWVLVLLPFLSHSLYETNLRTTLFSGLLALLISLNIVLSVFFFKMQKKMPSIFTSINSLGGMVAGILGLGCAACGSLFIMSTVASIGGIGILTALPLRGAEIGYFGLALLLVSAFSLIRHINAPAVCSI